MRPWVLFILIGLIVIACSETVSTESQVEKDATAPIDGLAIYKVRCIACHGINGDMGAAGAFNLTITKLSEEEKTLVVTNGRNTMPGFKNVLSAAEISAVVAYTENLKKLSD